MSVRTSSVVRNSQFSCLFCPLFVFFENIGAGLYFVTTKTVYLSYRSFFPNFKKFKNSAHISRSIPIESVQSFDVCSIFWLMNLNCSIHWLVTWRSLDSIALESGTNLKSVTADEADSPSTNIRVRRLFPEVWLFNSTTAGLVFAFSLSLLFLPLFQCLLKLPFVFSPLFLSKVIPQTRWLVNCNNFCKTFERWTNHEDMDGLFVRFYTRSELERWICSSPSV